MPGHTYLALCPVSEARERWFACPGVGDHQLPEENVALESALGRTLSGHVTARRSSPAFHGAAMDGFAVKASETFAASPSRPLKLGIGEKAFRINTGHKLPEGCNAVIMIENVNQEKDDSGEWIVIEKAAFPWQHVRKLGEDIVASEILLPPGSLIGAHEIGALAAGGVLEPRVFCRPRVHVIPSGSEIIPLRQASDAALASGSCLPEFNSQIFAAMVTTAGGQCSTGEIVPDDPDKIAAAINTAIDQGVDLVVVNAGSSAGSHDYTADVIARIGQVLVHGVAMMPGKPTVLGLVRNVPVMGAPGYPVSAMLAFEEFVLPLLALWQRRSRPERETVQAMLCNPLPSRPGMEEIIRVRLGQVGENFHAVPLARGAGTVTSLSRADAIVRVPANSEGLDAGSPVRAELLRPRSQIEGALLAIGSHDNTLDLIDSLLRKNYPRFRLTSAHVGSMGGLSAIAKRQCHLAGCHLLDTESGVYNQKAIAENLDLPVTLVRLVDREQGMILAPGNPLKLTGLADLARADVRFVNRQRGSGTRLLLDWKLAGLGIAASQVNGYSDEEYTHMNVAAAILSGRADAGLGVRSAANALGLDFIPVGMEEYDLVIPTSLMTDERILALLEVIRGQEFRETVKGMGGYGTEKTGETIWTWPGKQG